MWDLSPNNHQHLTLANRGDDHGCMRNDYISIDMRFFFFFFEKPEAKSCELMLKVDNIISSKRVVLSNIIFSFSS